MTAGMIETDPSVQIINKDHVIATLTEDVTFDMTLTVGKGSGYVTAAENIEDTEEQEVGLISVDSIYSHGAWAAVRGLTFPLLADFNPKGDVARRYSVYRDRDGFSERALYVVDVLILAPGGAAGAIRVNPPGRPVPAGTGPCCCVRCA